MEEEGFVPTAHAWVVLKHPCHICRNELEALAKIIALRLHKLYDKQRNKDLKDSQCWITYIVCNMARYSRREWVSEDNFVLVIFL